MLTNEKIQQTRKLINKGVPEGEIKNQLKAEGYSEEDIQKIFAPRPYDMRSWLLISAILLCLFAFYLFANYNTVPILLLILAGLLFYEYYKADKRIRNEK